MSCTCNSQYTKLPCCCQAQTTTTTTMAPCVGGELCDVMYSTDCLIYDKADIDCLGIRSGDSYSKLLESIIVTLTPCLPTTTTTTTTLPPCYCYQLTWSGQAVILGDYVRYLNCYGQIRTYVMNAAQPNNNFICALENSIQFFFGADNGVATVVDFSNCADSCATTTTTTTIAPTTTTTTQAVGPTTTTTTSSGLDVIYYGHSLLPGIPSATDITAGSVTIQNGANDVSIDWSGTYGSPYYLWWAIPALGPAYLKNVWYENVINNGDMGNLGDLFEFIDIVNVGGDDYYVAKTAYNTEFANPVLLKKV